VDYEQIRDKVLSKLKAGGQSLAGKALDAFIKELAKTKRSPISDPFAQRLRFGVGQCGMNFWAMTN